MGAEASNSDPAINRRRIFFIDLASTMLHTLERGQGIRD
jgi:hypothetical protein